MSESEAQSVVAIVYGRPGAGKGTACRITLEQLTAEGYPTVHLESGAMLRDPNNPYHTKAKPYMDRGDLVPVPIIVPLMSKSIRDTLANPNVTVAMLDGFPRNREQASALIPELRGTPSIHIDIDTPAEECIRRILENTREDRSDDNPETVRNRQQVYDEDTYPMMAHIEEMCMSADSDALFYRLNGLQKPEAVVGEAKGLIQEVARNGIHVVRRKFFRGVTIQPQNGVFASH